PGHELAGEIAACGTGVSGFEPGERVTVHPLIGCGACQACDARLPESCPQARMIGVERHGAFAEYLCVPAHAVWKLPDGVSWIEGAYTEPIAAIMGIFRAGITPEQSGWVMGSNRIAVLSSRVLQQRGFDAGQGPLDFVAPNSLDYLVESGLTADELPRVLEVLKPGGVLIAKSRHIESLPLPWSTIVRKDLRIQGLYYGSFGAALDFLAEDPEGLYDLLADLAGPEYRLDDWRGFLTPAETSKPFLVFD
ncbi:MAG: alcohol dehydrogenase catalytic domain-containing protein, partial [Candidatus Sericytochromatia bacterium]